MALLTQEALDEFEARQNAQFEAIRGELAEMTTRFEEFVVIMQSHGKLLGEVVALVSKLGVSRASRAPSGRETPRPEACEAAP